MRYKPQPQVFNKVKKTPDGAGGYTEERKARGTLYGYLDMLNADDDQAIQAAHIEDSKFVIVLRKQDNVQPWAFIPKKGDVVTDELGRDYIVTFCDNPVGINHHLEVLLDFLPNGVA